MQVRSMAQEDPLEEEMATHSSILAWRIPWTEEPGGLQSIDLVAKSRTRPKRLSTYVVILRGLVPESPSDIKIWGCSSPSL